MAAPSSRPQPSKARSGLRPATAPGLTASSYPAERNSIELIGSLPLRERRQPRTCQLHTTGMCSWFFVFESLHPEAIDRWRNWKSVVEVQDVRRPDWEHWLGRAYRACKAVSTRWRFFRAIGSSGLSRKAIDRKS